MKNASSVEWILVCEFDWKCLRSSETQRSTERIAKAIVLSYLRGVSVAGCRAVINCLMCVAIEKTE